MNMVSVVRMSRIYEQNVVTHCLIRFFKKPPYFHMHISVSEFFVGHKVFYIAPVRNI